MHLKILGHPIFMNLGYHLPLVVDLSHPLIMLTGENGSGKSTLLHSVYYALKGEQVEGYAYKMEAGKVQVRTEFSMHLATAGWMYIHHA